MAGKLSGTAIEDGSLTEDVLEPSINLVVDAGPRPKITSIVYANNDLAVVALQNNTVELTGSGFVSGLMVYVNGDSASSITYNNANSIFATIKPLNSGTYPLYVVNPDGGTGILAPGITSSFYPTWVTNTTFTVFAADWTYQLNANSDSPITYTLAPGNTLPGGITLSSNGLLSGALTSPPLNDTTYNFYVVATDSELQSETRQFSATSLARIAATGGEIINVGAYRIHTFNTSGTFEVTGGAGEIEYLVVAGGGGGGTPTGGTSGSCGGGGGAGGYRTSNGNFVAGNSYSVVIGAGGAASANGSFSSFDSFTSAGGGRGGASGADAAGRPGGSGGGGGSSGGAGGTGNIPATTPSQGNNGAGGTSSQQYGDVAGGGGGANGVGSSFSSGAGGAGITTTFSGSPLTLATGGRGGQTGGSLTAPVGAENTGNGGGGGGGGSYQTSPGAAGGSGIVILRYLI